MEIMKICSKCKNKRDISEYHKGRGKDGLCARCKDCVKKHLEISFENNYKILFKNRDRSKKLHIDHVIPLSLAKTEEELIGLNHYINLQYLYDKDNLEKHDKLDWKLQN